MYPEEKSLANLSASPYNLASQEITMLGELFDRLRRVEDASARLSPFELYEAHWATLGMMGRTYELLLCGVDQLAGGNRNGFYVAARGLVETLCTLVWINDNTERLSNLVQSQGARIGTMLNSGYRKYIDLESLYSYLSGIVHPGRASHLLGFRPREERAEKGVWTPFGLTFSDYFAKEMLNILLVIGSRIMDEFEKLASGGEVIMRKGRLMTYAKKQDSNRA